MSRLVIDVSGEQHQKIKVLAALEGKTVKDYVLEKIFPEDNHQNNDWEEFRSAIMQRIESAEKEPAATKTFEELTQEIIAKKTAKK